MQQSIQRMAGQVQSMQQEVRELTQLAQQLSQQNMNHYQQFQGMNVQNNPTMYQLMNNEQQSAMLLQKITEVCSEMNTHMKTIAQQLTSTSGTNNGYQTGNTYQNQSSSAGTRAPEGPIATDTTHMSRFTVPGRDTSMYGGQQYGSNTLQGTSGTSVGANYSTNDGSASMRSGGGSQGAQMGMSATQTQGQGQAQSRQNQGFQSMQSTSISSMSTDQSMNSVSGTDRQPAQGSITSAQSGGVQGYIPTSGAVYSNTTGGGQQSRYRSTTGSQNQYTSSTGGGQGQSQYGGTTGSQNQYTSSTGGGQGQGQQGGGTSSTRSQYQNQVQQGNISGNISGNFYSSIGSGSQGQSQQGGTSGSQNQYSSSTSGSQGQGQQSQGSNKSTGMEQQMRNNLNENREELHYDSYPFNRYTT